MLTGEPAPFAEEPPMTRLETDEDIAKGLRALTRKDPELRPIRKLAGAVPLRRRPPGFDGLARIIVGQQLSVASAAAIWGRFEKTLGKVEAGRVLKASEETLRSAGLSGPKIRTLTAVSEVVAAGAIDLEGLADQDPEEAHAALCALHGIGPWSADVYLLFCAGHRDIFPAGDLALQVAVQEGLGLAERPNAKDLAALAAERWRPWRGAAAHLFWAFYREVKGGRAVLPA